MNAPLVTTPTPDFQTYTVKEVSGFLSCSENQVRCLIAEGHLETCSISRSGGNRGIRVSAKALLRFIENGGVNFDGLDDLFE